MQEGLHITKFDGEQVLFDRSKLVRSLRRSGADTNYIEEVMPDIEAQIYNGITSKKLHQIAFRILKKSKRKEAAAKYNLKAAIMQLGPSGYPFEAFVGKLLAHRNYNTRVGVNCQGRFVTHEVDIVAENKKECILVECKYRNKATEKVSVQVPMYIRSRFEDIELKWKEQVQYANKEFKGWVVTNTKFSKDAEAYGKGIGLRLIGWAYPQNQSLQYLIEKYHLYPVTCLSSLTKAQKSALLKFDIILCKDLIQQEGILTRMKIKPNKTKTIMEEARALCAE